MLLLGQSPNVFDPNATSYYPPQSLVTQLYAPPDPATGVAGTVGRGRGSTTWARGSSGPNERQPATEPAI
jgi:hypothetical protein